MITQTIETITPEMAKKYLEHNKSNRTIARERVNAYAEDMKHGMWTLNGEAIKFDKEGNLIDGQHRLTAIVRSGVSVETAVLRGIEKGVTIFDAGRVRSQRDIVVLNGIEGHRAAGPVIGSYKLLYKIMSGRSTVPNWFIFECDEYYGGTMAQLCALARRKGSKSARVAGRSAVLLAGLYAVGHGVPMETLSKFFETLNTGFYDTPAERAAVVLRNDILSVRRSDTTVQKQVFLGTERAIVDYCNGYERTKTYLHTSKFVWPLDECEVPKE